MNSAGIRTFLFVLSLYVLVDRPTSLLAQFPFSDMPYAQNINSRAYLCTSETITSIFAQPDTEFETVLSGRRMVPVNRLYILLLIQNYGFKRAWGEVEIGFYDRTVKIPIDSLPPSMKLPFYWVVEITDLKWLVEGKALPEAVNVKWKKLYSK